MTAPRQTPGPWYLERQRGSLHIRDRANGHKLATVFSGPVGDQAAANARIIAAAPDLLALAKEAAEFLDSAQPSDFNWEQAGAILHRLRAAIARSER